MGLWSQNTLNSVLAEFGLPRPAETHLLRHSAVKRDELVRVEFGAVDPVLVRFHDPRFYKHSDIEHQTRFRSHLFSCGIPVPRLYRDTLDRLFLDVYLEGETWVVTVEQWVAGQPPETVTPPLISLMGTTLAGMHLAALSSGVSFGHGTDMSLLVEGEEYAKCATMLRTSLQSLDLGEQGQTRLFARWELARERLRGLWQDLPTGPVHADFAEYNLLLDETENIAAVIDFNLAGDDVFVNELVHACLWLPSSGQDEHDRAGIARFIQAYEAVRPLSDSERLAVPYLITAIRPFRWREISPLLKAAEKRDRDSVLRGLARLERLAEPLNLLA